MLCIFTVLCAHLHLCLPYTIQQTIASEIGPQLPSRENKEKTKPAPYRVPSKKPSTYVLTQFVHVYQFYTPVIVIVIYTYM